MKIAMRHILMGLVSLGLLYGGKAVAADYATSDARATGAETIAPGSPRPFGASANAGATIVPDAGYRSGATYGDEIVGQNEPTDGLFGESPPSVCEICGGGHCMPAQWSVDAAVQVMSFTRPVNRLLGSSSLPGGPFQVTAGTGAVSGGTVQTIEYAFFNNIFNTPALAVDTPGKSVSPGLDLIISHFLGRDGENRDYFLQAEYSGPERFYGNHEVAGTLVPVYAGASTVPNQTSPGNPLVYTGSLLSPFVFPTPNVSTSPFNPTTQQTFNPLNAYAFNGATLMSANTWSTFNNWELNFLVAGNNQPDQMVLNPNGHWYRQCKNGFFYNYLFGLRAMVIDEMYEFISDGVTTLPNGTPVAQSHGRYVTRTENCLLGLQTGGTLEYRFCRWELDMHSKVGMFVNFANQDSHVQATVSGSNIDYLGTNFPGYPQSGTVTGDNLYNAGSTQVAFAGGFGVGGSYKIRPNVVAHVSYDVLWVGDVARAGDQFQFSPIITPIIVTKGSEFYDGVNFGLELDW